MKSVDATELKNHLGAVLAQAALGPIAIKRHGRVVAVLVPPPQAPARRSQQQGRAAAWNRRVEERVIQLCAQRDFRPSRWARAGDPRTLAGVATLLASRRDFDRNRMLALAERLWPGMTSVAEFGRWLAQTPIQAARLLPMIEARLRACSLVGQNGGR